MPTGVSTIDKFIPEVWSARLISNLQKKMVYGNLVNRDYEGEISGKGDTVHVHNIGAVSLMDYGRNGVLPRLDTLTDGRTTLTITEAQAFNFMVDDIDKAQTNAPVMEEAMKEAGYAMANDSDTFIASLYPEATAGEMSLDNGFTTDKGKFYDLFVAIRQQFREANVPIDELGAVIAPWMESMVLLDERFIHATSAGDTVLKTGELGRIAGVTLYVSNNVPVETETTNKVLTFSGKKGVSFADQINKTEAYRPEDRFADAVKGLHVYGAKTMRPEFVICSDVIKA